MWRGIERKLDRILAALDAAAEREKIIMADLTNLTGQVTTLETNQTTLLAAVQAATADIATIIGELNSTTDQADIDALAQRLTVVNAALSGAVTTLQTDTTDMESVPPVAPPTA